MPKRLWKLQNHAVRLGGIYTHVYYGKCKIIGKGMVQGNGNWLVIHPLDEENSRFSTWGMVLIPETEASQYKYHAGYSPDLTPGFLVCYGLASDLEVPHE